MGKIKIKLIDDPKKRLELLLNFSALISGYFFIYVYQNMLHINVELIDFKTLIQLPIIALLVMPLIHYIIIKTDPLQRSPSARKRIIFFQREFPSNYILERCERCVENESTCANFIKTESYKHVRHWFNIFHNHIERENPQLVRDTFEKGYTCKLLYYLSWILGIFFILGVILIIFHHIYLYLSDKFSYDLTALQLIYVIVAGGVIILINKLNRPDERDPSGCWQAWREINRMHISWLRDHEDFLVSLICQAGGISKRFKER